MCSLFVVFVTYHENIKNTIIVQVVGSLVMTHTVHLSLYHDLHFGIKKPFFTSNHGFHLLDTGRSSRHFLQVSKLQVMSSKFYE